jgi:hypothetical protein
VAAWPTLKEVRTLLRLQPDPVEDAVIQTAMAAAIDYGIRRLGSVTTIDPSSGSMVVTPKYPVDTQDLPDAGHEACLLHSARLYRRRDSLDGTIGWGDMGAIRVGRLDPDVDMLYATLGPMVFG